MWKDGICDACRSGWGRCRGPLVNVSSHVQTRKGTGSNMVHSSYQELAMIVWYRRCTSKNKNNIKMKLKQRRRTQHRKKRMKEGDRINIIRQGTVTL